jgi:hypothetical protein
MQERSGNCLLGVMPVDDVVGAGTVIGVVVCAAACAAACATKTTSCTRTRVGFKVQDLGFAAWV